MLRTGPVYLTLLLFLTLGAERAGLQADFPERSERVVTYTMEVELLPEKQTVHGAMDLVWRNTSDEPVQQLFFHLYLNAFRDKDSTFMREGDGAGRRGSRWDKHYPGSVTVNSMKTTDGTELWKEGTQRFVQPDDGNEKDRTLARVDLPAPVAPGETIALKIDFDSKMPRVFRRTGWAGDPDKPNTLFFMVAQWFPKIAVLRRGPDGKSHWNRHQFHFATEFFSDYGVYRVRITAPNGYKIGATGPRISGRTDNGDGTFSVVHEQADVHDFAWTASPHFVVKEFKWTFDSFCDEAPNGMGKRIRELLARTAKHLGVEQDKIKPKQAVAMRILLQPDHEKLADRFRWAAGASLACYGIWFGQYPYEVLTILDPPSGGGAAGGMEYPTLITVWGDRTAPDYVTGMEGVTIHEFGHQFFYGLLGSNEFEEAWLDEGFTSYTDSRVYAIAYGPGLSRTRYSPFHTPHFRPFTAPGVFSKLSRMLKLGKWVGKLPRLWSKPRTLLPTPGGSGLWEYMRDMPLLHLPTRVKTPQPGGERGWVLGVHSHDAMVMPGWHYASRGDYGVNSYGKPTVFLYCLRGLMGEESFDRAMRAYAASYRFRHPTTADFLKIVRENTAAKTRDALDGFIDAMVNSAARLDVAIVSAKQFKLDNGKWIYRVKVQRRGQIPVPLEVRADGALIGTWLSRGRETTKTFSAVRDKPFVEVRIGPDWIRNLDSDLTNNARLAEKDGRAAVVTAVRWSLYVEDIVRTYAGMGR